MSQGQRSVPQPAVLFLLPAAPPRLEGRGGGIKRYGLTNSLPSQKDDSSVSITGCALGSVLMKTLRGPVPPVPGLLPPPCSPCCCVAPVIVRPTLGSAVTSWKAERERTVGRPVGLSPWDSVPGLGTGPVGRAVSHLTTHATRDAACPLPPSSRCCSLRPCPALQPSSEARRPCTAVQAVLTACSSSE